MLDTKYKVAASQNNAKQSPHVISQEEDDHGEANTHPADNTRARRAHRMLNPRLCNGHNPLTQKLSHQLQPSTKRNDRDSETRKQFEYCHLKKHPKYLDIWKMSYENEIRRLGQEMLGRVKETSTMLFIGKNDITPNRIHGITYGRFVCDYREGKV